jgi:hypothetical protein
MYCRRGTCLHFYKTKLNPQTIERKTMSDRVNILTDKPDPDSRRRDFAVAGSGEAHTLPVGNSTERDVLLSALRSAVLIAKLDANELQTIGIALRSNMISPEDAIAWLVDIGLVTQVIPDREVRQ